jgi:hypothetical protein
MLITLPARGDCGRAPAYFVAVQTMTEADLRRQADTTWRCHCGHVEQDDNAAELRRKARQHAEVCR